MSWIVSILISFCALVDFVFRSASKPHSRSLYQIQTTLTVVCRFVQRTEKREQMELILKDLHSWIDSTLMWCVRSQRAARLSVGDRKTMQERPLNIYWGTATTGTDVVVVFSVF